jgi:hypothetical protein
MGMNNIELKNGDVIVITTHGDDFIAIFNKIDKSLWGTNDAFHLYADLYKNSLTCIGDTNECAYDINDIHYRHASDEEKHEMYNALGKRFTDDYDKDWYNHFSDSSYFDVQDFLFDVFGINVEYYDNDMIYPDFINEIHKYIWDGLCDAMKMPNEMETFEFTPVSNEMVNKQEFIEKVIEWVKNRDNVEKYLHVRTSLTDNFADALRKYLEERL